MKTKHLKKSIRQGSRQRQAGMTLVEVVIALAITALAIGGICNGYSYCTTSAQKAALTLAASARAMERIEETRSAIWDTAQSPIVDQLVATNFPTKSVALDLSGSGDVVLPATVQTVISDISANPPLKRIRVDCIWSFKGREMITNTIETCRAPDQ